VVGFQERAEQPVAGCGNDAGCNPCGSNCHLGSGEQFGFGDVIHVQVLDLRRANFSPGHEDMLSAYGCILPTIAKEPFTATNFDGNTAQPPAIAFPRRLSNLVEQVRCLHNRMPAKTI
jgi:hypothetical protein